MLPVAIGVAAVVSALGAAPDGAQSEHSDAGAPWPVTSDAGRPAPEKARMAPAPAPPRPEDEVPLRPQVAPPVLPRPNRTGGGPDRVNDIHIH
jgi:hypothetical protein